MLDSILAEMERWALWYMRIKSVVFIGLGVTWFFMPSETRAAGIGWLHFATTELVGWMWIITGTIGIIGSVCRPVAKWGWAFLVFTPAALALYFLTAWIIYLVPTIDGGAERGIITTISYSAFVASAFCMSKLHSLTRAMRRPRGTGAH